MFRSVIVVVVVAVAGLAGCASLAGRDPLQVSVAGIEPMQEKGEGLEFRMLVKLRVQNPNSAPISYDGAYVKIEVQDRTFATGVTDLGGSLPGFGETVVEVPVTVSMLRMFRNVLAMGGDAPAESLSYAMSGKLGSHRFKATGELTIKPPAPEPAAAGSI